MQRITFKSLALFLSLIFLLSGLTSCAPDLDRKTKEGATVGAVAGGVIGILFDTHNRWRGAVLGAAIGAVIGGTAAYIMERAGKDAAKTKRPVTYVSEDGVQKVYAKPVKSEGKCEWVTIEYYEYGKLVKEEKRKVCSES